MQEAIESLQRNDLLASSRDQLAVWQGLRSSKAERDFIEAVQRSRNGALEHIEQWKGLGAKLHEGLDAVSQSELAAFKPGYEELAGMAALAKPAWGELLTSPTASYAFAAMAALREAMERAPFAEETIAALHNQLGDWRGVNLSAELFDQQKRQEVYLRTGLDQRLVNLEPQTFDAMLGATD